MNISESIRGFGVKFILVAAIVMMFIIAVFVVDSLKLFTTGQNVMKRPSFETVSILSYPECPSFAIPNIDDARPTAYVIECLNHSGGGQEVVLRFIELEDMNDELRAHITYDPNLIENQDG